jgi:PAS domain S-box-containing protein
MGEHEQDMGCTSASKAPAETDLRYSEERFRLLVESVKDYAIFLLDPHGYVTSWNAGARRIKGYADEEIIGKHFSCFYPAEALERDWPNHELTVAQTEGRFEDEGWRIRKDGSLFWANVVITALYDAQGELRGFAKVTRDMTERKRVESLEESKRQMNGFLAMLSHELRNPLAPIRSAVGIMRMKELHDPTLEWARDVIDRQIEQLARLVDDLLDVSRITTGKIMLKKETLEIPVAVTRAVESCKPLLDARKHHLEVNLPATRIQVEGDLIRLSQVFLNLLNNAAKYTPERGHIRLSIEQEQHEVVVRVRDTGIGIPSNLLTTIFDLFTQGTRDLDRAEGGLGVGLTLVRQIVELHGGTVAAYSDGLGKGSEFVVRLPLLDLQFSTSAAQDKDKRREAQTGACRVLVVDDNVDAAESVAMLLRLWNYESRTAHDGPAALSLASKYRPHVVLLDIGLPGMDGYEVAKRLQGLSSMEGSVLIALTGYGQDEDRRRARDAGFNDHLLKPVRPDTLEAVLSKLSRPSAAST